MKTRGPMLRLFVAVYPPPQTVQALAAAAGALSLPEHRPTPPDQIHLTVLFLGPTPVRDLDTITESISRAASGIEPFSLRPTRTISLPRRGPARLIAAEVEPHPSLLELHRRLAHRLASRLRPKAEDRFTPHMTLCRFTRPAPLAPKARLAAPLDAAAFLVDRLLLMKSVLRPDRAEHRPVAEAVLSS